MKIFLDHPVEVVMLILNFLKYAPGIILGRESSSTGIVCFKYQPLVSNRLNPTAICVLLLTKLEDNFVPIEILRFSPIFAQTTKISKFMRERVYKLEAPLLLFYRVFQKELQTWHFFKFSSNKHAGRLGHITSEKWYS